MIKCLFKCKNLNYAIHLNLNENVQSLNFDEFKKQFLNKYYFLIVLNQINMENDIFQIYDQDFKEYVVIDEYTKIKNLSRINLFQNFNFNNTLTKDVKRTCIMEVGCQTDEIERRIIHLKENPFKEKFIQFENDYKRLIEENKRLIAKIELYKQGNALDATKQLDDIVFKADSIKNLEQELENTKLKQKNIIEAFKKTSKDFREIVYLLTGFKFDALKQKTYKLSHVYADANDFLMFNLENERIINLLETEFSQKFLDLIEKFLVDHDSYPSFLASITIRLFKERENKFLK